MKKRIISFCLIGIMLVSFTSANVMVFAEEDFNSVSETVSEEKVDSDDVLKSEELTNEEAATPSETSDSEIQDTMPSVNSEISDSTQSEDIDAIVDNNVVEDIDAIVDNNVVEDIDAIVDNNVVEDIDATVNDNVVEDIVENDIMAEEITDDSNIGKPINEVVKTEDTIILYEETENVDLQDVVIEEQIKEDGTQLLTVGTEPFVVEEENSSFNLLNSFVVDENVEAPTLENDNWSNVPSHYGYSYDTSDTMNWGAWGGNGNLQGYKATSVEDNNINNELKMYTDGNDVHLYISYASLFNGTGNGNDYNFTVDGQNTKYRVVLEDGSDLTSVNLAPGTYNLKVINGAGSISGTDVLGANGTLIVKENNCNNVMTISVPIEQMYSQNSNINKDVVQNISFNSPNIFMGTLSCAGAGNNKLLYIIGSYAIFLLAGYCLKKNGGLSTLLVS